MRIHFIAIGGSVMHNLAVALHKAGHQVSGSDDEIYEPSRSRLAQHGLLPSAIGWFPERIDKSLDVVILGMHARADNPELLAAQSLGVRVCSYPEYIYEHSRHKERVVISGSHGKTTTTAMVMHVLQHCGMDFDYVVGAALEGFDGSVRLSDSAPVIVIEGDEYFASPLDRTPKFLHYKHHIGLVSGIAWDHINVYPDFDEYVRQFEAFAVQTPKAGTLIYCEEDDLATIACSSNKMREDINSIDYKTHPHTTEDGKAFLRTEDGEKIPLRVFGQHNMQNISGAKAVCSRLGVTKEQFYAAIQHFKGAKNRLEVLAERKGRYVFRDFAHAPSKVAATTRAVKTQFGTQTLVACLELHTFSSLNKKFLPQYAHALDAADVAAVYFNPQTIAHKKLEPLTPQDVKNAFGRVDLQVFTEVDALLQFMQQHAAGQANFLLMSSGTYNNTPHTTWDALLG